MTNAAILDFYTQQSKHTSPGHHSLLFRNLPEDVGGAMPHCAGSLHLRPDRGAVLRLQGAAIAKRRNPRADSGRNARAGSIAREAHAGVARSRSSLATMTGQRRQFVAASGPPTKRRSFALARPIRDWCAEVYPEMDLITRALILPLLIGALATGVFAG